MTNNDKTALVTGANSGIGFETVTQLAERGYRNIILVSRTVVKAENTAALLRDRGYNNNFISMAMDTSEVDSAKAAADELIEMGVRIDFLILNAGSSAGELAKNSDGVDMTFASTLVGHHVLTMKLLEAELLADDVNIVIAGSEAARGDVMGMSLPDLDGISELEFENDMEKTLEAFAMGYAPEKYHVMKAYSIAKLYVAWWASALSEKVTDGMRVFAISPGSVPSTNFARNGSFMMKYVMMPLMKSIGKFVGAAAPVSAGALRYLSAVDLPDTTNGGFYASPPKKMIGNAELQHTDYLKDNSKRDAAWNVIVNFAGGIDYPGTGSRVISKEKLERKIA